MHMASTGRRGGQTNDNIADQLNREEANRLAAGGNMPAPGSSQPSPMGQGAPAPGTQPMR